MCLQELVEGIVQCRAAVGGAKFLFQWFERLQSQDASRIEPVGIASPLLDARDREPCRPCLQRRSRFGTRPRLISIRPVECIGPGEVAPAAALDVFGWGR